MPTFDEQVVASSATSFDGTVVGNNTDPSDQAGPGVKGTSKGVGVVGESQTWHAVFGNSQSTTGGAGVVGHAVGPGVIGESQTWIGVFGKSDSTTGGSGVMGEAIGAGVIGKSSSWHGVYGETSGSAESGAAAVVGENKANGSGVMGISASGAGVFASGSPAGFFKGDVIVTGDLVLQGADYAESLTVADTPVSAGMVVVLDDDGRIRPCTEEYDTRVAGVVSGAGGVKPAIVLDRHDDGAPVALAGKLWVMADADGGPIRCGDLLTTSANPGHARPVADRTRAFGAVVGKALTSLESGTGLVRVLVSTT